LASVNKKIKDDQNLSEFSLGQIAGFCTDTKMLLVAWYSISFHYFISKFRELLSDVCMQVILVIGNF
jgi:hypothetical protein